MSIIEFDHILFELINNKMSNDFFDLILPIWRNKYTWLPLYVFITSFLMINYGRKGIMMLFFIIVTVSTSDFTSSQLIKKNVERPRPCHLVSSLETVNVRVHCGSGYSFTSSHATNHFALAVFLCLLIGRKHLYTKVSLMAWAFVVAFSQVYVGVHFPIDVLSGGLLGYIIARVYHNIYLFVSQKAVFA